MKPKILFILHYPPPVHGAAMVGKYIMDSKRINTAFDARYLNLGTSVAVDDIGKGGVKKIFRYFKLLFNTASKILCYRPQLVYLTLTSKGVGFYKDALVALLAKALGAKMLYHFHNKGVSSHQDRWFDNLLYQMVFKKAEVILLSEHLYPDVKKYVPLNRVHFCSNGIPEIEATRKTSIESKNEPVNLLFLSNLIGTKGVFVLLEACELLMHKNLNFQCTYVGGEGDISATEINEEIERRNLQDCIKYAGKKYDQEKHKIFSEAAIFVHPTSDDCYPLVLLEAMQFSLPVISTFEGGIPDIVEDGVTGFLVPQKNVEALAEKLEILIKNPTLSAQMGAAGRKKYEKEFTLTTFEQRFTCIIKNLVL